MRSRFLADVDFNRSIVNGARRREPSIDFFTSQAFDLNGLDDVGVLAVAAREGRVLVSHDYSTMPRHFQRFRVEHESPGVFLISQALPIARAIEEILLIWEASDASEWVNQVTYLPL